MLLRLLLLLILIPLADLLVLLWIAQHTSAGLAFSLVIVSGVAGVAIMRWQGFRSWSKVRSEVQAGHTPAAALLDSLLIFIAGVLLIVPGVITDVVAIILLVPPVRRGVRKYFLRWIELRFFGARGAPWKPVRDTIVESRVIESRVIETRPPSGDPQHGTDK